MFKNDNVAFERAKSAAKSLVFMLQWSKGRLTDETMQLMKDVINASWESLEYEEKLRFVSYLSKALEEAGYEKAIIDELRGEVISWLPSDPPTQIVQGIWKYNVPVVLPEKGETVYGQYYRASCKVVHSIKEGGLPDSKYSSLMSPNIRHANISMSLVEVPLRPVVLFCDQWSTEYHLGFSGMQGDQASIEITYNGGSVINRESKAGIVTCKSISGKPGGATFYTSGVSQCTVLCLYCDASGNNNNNNNNNNKIILALAHIGGGDYKMNTEYLLDGMDDKGKVKAVLGLKGTPSGDDGTSRVIENVLGQLVAAGVSQKNFTVYKNCWSGDSFGIDWKGNWGEVLDSGEVKRH